MKLKFAIIGLISLLMAGAVIATTMEKNTDDIIVSEDIIVEPTPTPEPTIEPTPTPTPTPEIVYPDDWTCFDYSMNYRELHPEWGVVVISNNPTFKGYPDPVTHEGNNHFVNYQILPDKTLLIHDGMYGAEYTASEWQYDDLTFEYYHFYINGELPTRTWRTLKPNAAEVYNEL